MKNANPPDLQRVAVTEVKDQAMLGVDVRQGRGAALGVDVSSLFKATHAVVQGVDEVVVVAMLEVRSGTDVWRVQASRARVMRRVTRTSLEGGGADK